jgi:MFS family permease
MKLEQLERKVAAGRYTMPRSLRPLLLLVTWCLLLALRVGDPFDENEHCHAAWLMGVEGERPIHDFFQHHQPLLWDVLVVYYRLGGRGPEVLYFGRLIVAVCGGLFFVGLVLLARRREGDSTAGLLDRAAWGLLPVIALGALIPTVLVIRPEALSLPLCVVALVLWTHPAEEARRSGERGYRFAQAIRDLLAGAAFGAGVFSSPRFLLLGGAFLLLPRDRQRVWESSLPRMLSLAVGGVVFLLSYLAVTPYRLADFYFNIQFTRTLGGFGSGNFGLTPRLLLFAVILVGLLTWQYAWLARAGRRRFLLHTGYLVVLFGLSLLSCWPFVYGQYFLPGAVWASAMLTLAGPEKPCAEARHEVRVQAAIYPATVLCLLLLSDLRDTQTVVARIGCARHLLGYLEPDDCVLVSGPFHPIAARDASFFNNPIVGGHGRLQKAVAREADRWPLPACDYLADIRRRQPKLIDNRLVDALPEQDHAEFSRMLQENYTPLDPRPKEDPGQYYCVFLRKSPP